MQKVCHDWPNEAFIDGLVDEKYWDGFLEKANIASAKVSRVKNWEEAEAKLVDILKGLSAGEYDDRKLETKEILAVGEEEFPFLKGVYSRLAEAGYTVYTDKFDIARHKDSANVGITLGEFGVAETGSVAVDNLSYEARVASMLPYTNIVFMPAKYMVENLTSALKIMGKVFNKGYMGLVTGPSRTADIERVLSLGVHGPNYFFVIAIDEMSK